MLDRRLVLAMIYHPDGTFGGSEEVTGRAARALVAVADLAWKRAVPLPQWRARRTPSTASAAWPWRRGDRLRDERRR
jgi:hypothetical protein